MFIVEKLKYRKEKEHTITNMSVTVDMSLCVYISVSIYLSIYLKLLSALFKNIYAFKIGNHVVYTSCFFL